MKKFLFSILLGALAAIWAPYSIEAQERSVDHKIVVDIHFLLSDGEESGINKSIGEENLQNALQNLDLINADSTATIERVEFYSSVSPEGSTNFNKQLCKKRLQTAEKIVRRHLYIPESAIIAHDNQYIPWEQVLIPAIKADSEIPYRDELLKLLENRGNESRREALINANNGKLYAVVKDRYFEVMRRGGAIITIRRDIYDDLILQLDLLGAEVSTPSTDALISLDLTAQKNNNEKEEHRMCPLHLKTNALGWGLAIANVAAEFDFAKHWSFSLPIYYSAINYFTSTVKFRTFSIQPEVRYWLKESNVGFFAGTHFGLGYYNVATNGELRYQDHNGKSPAIGGGISIGYRLAISRNKRWNIDFSIGAGGYKLYYDTFYNVSNGRLVGSYRKSYWGLDNAAANISYRFDFNKRKR